VTGGVPVIFAQLPSWLQDIALLLVIFAFFSCGTTPRSRPRSSNSEQSASSFSGIG